MKELNLKITNYCNANCVYCCEDSSINGSHINLLDSNFLESLKGTEKINMNGGNPLHHPQLMQFLNKCKELNIKTNLTLNQKHFGESFHTLMFLEKSNFLEDINVSLTEASNEFINAIKLIPNFKINVVVGLVTGDQLTKLANNNFKLNILGFNKAGRGESYFNRFNTIISENTTWLKNNINKVLSENWFDEISFDDLAKDQLDLNKKSELIEEVKEDVDADHKKRRGGTQPNDESVNTTEKEVITIEAFVKEVEAEPIIEQKEIKTENKTTAKKETKTTSNKKETKSKKTETKKSTTNKTATKKTTKGK